MVKVATKQPQVVEDQAAPEETSKGRNPDYVVLLRQQPQLGGDGKRYRSSNFTTVGAAWKSEKMDEKTGEMVEYIGLKAHIPFQVGEEGLLLRTYREQKR